MVNKDGLLFTKDPQNSQYEFQVSRREFIAASYRNSNSSCNIFDFLKLHLGSYEKAVDYVLDSYHNLIQSPGGLSIDSVRAPLVESLTEARQQFKEILALGNDLRLHEHSIGEVYLYCRSKGISPDYAWRIFYVVLGRKLNTLLQYCPGAREFDAEAVYLVYPFLKNHHTFSRLEVQDLRRGLVRNLELNPSRYNYFGLHSCLPNHDQIQVWPSAQEALIRHAQAMEMSEFTLGFLNVAINPRANAPEVLLPAGVFMVTGTPDFNTLVKTRAAFENFSVYDHARDVFAKQVQGKPWTEYALNATVDLLNRDRELSPRLSAMIQSLQSDPPVYRALLDHFEKQGKRKLVERIRSRFDSQRVYSVGGVQIKETPTGYEALEPEQETPIQLTNFVIELDSSVWFEESDEIFFTGRVILNGNALPFLIAQEELEQARLIRRAAQRALNRQALDTALPLPSITEPALQAKLVSLLAQQIGNKPRRLGVERLGWNEAKTRFVSPAWQVQSSGVQPTSRILHPGSTLLASHFRSVQPIKDLDGSKASPQGRQLVAVLAALLTRAFLNEQTPALSVRRTPQALTLLQAVFRPLGQVAALELSAKGHEAEQTLGKKNFLGYPLYATAPQGAQLERINYPLLLLSESGFPVTDRPDNQAREHTSSLAYRVLSALVLSLVREGPQVHGLSRSQSAKSWPDLIQEGKRLIEARCGLGQFDLLEPQSPLLFGILAQNTPEQLRACFHQERAGATIRVLCRKLNGVTRQPLYQELAAQNPGVKLLGDHYILCPAEWFGSLLEHYYGMGISLPRAKASPDLTQASAATCKTNGPGSGNCLVP